MTVEELVRLGDSHLEDDRYAEARDAYRAAIDAGAIETELMEGLLRNHSVAVENEPVVFLRRAADRFGEHREGWRLWMAFASALGRVRAWGNALVFLNKLLQRPLPEREVPFIRLSRFRAAVRSYASAFQPQQAAMAAADDMALAWAVPMEQPVAGALRRSMLRELAALDDPRFEPLLQVLGDAVPGDAGLHAFLRAKAVELRELARVSPPPFRSRRR